MSVTLYAYDVTAGRLPGQVTVSGGKITTATNRAIEGRVRALMAKGVAAEKAVADLDGWSNGHVIWATTAPDVPAWLAGPVTAGWRSELHPRGRGGKFAHTPGGGVARHERLAAFAGKGLPAASGDEASSAAKARVAAKVAAEMRSPTADLVAAGGHDAWSRWPVHDDKGWEFRLEPHTGFLQAQRAGFKGTAGWERGGSPAADQVFRRAAAGNLVRQWAKTSNDHDGKSLAVQEATRREFGLTRTEPWAMTAADEAWERSDLALHGRVYRDFVRAQYNVTQADLAAEGITALRLYRGLAWPAGVAIPGEYRTAGDVNLSLRPLSSWSHDPATAQEYAAGVGPTQEPGGARGAVLEAEIPASQILSYPQGGMGSINLGEFVALGQPTPAHLTLLGGAATAARGAAAVDGATERNEDWLRTRGWDLPGVTDLGHLLTALDLDGQPAQAQRQGVEAFTRLAAWEAAPAGLRGEVDQFLAGGGPGG